MLAKTIDQQYIETVALILRTRDSRLKIKKIVAVTGAAIDFGEFNKCIPTATEHGHPKKAGIQQSDCGGGWHGSLSAGVDVSVATILSPPRKVRSL